MKRWAKLPESTFLKILFAMVSAAFITAAFCMPDAAQLWQGFWHILSQPGKIFANYFAIGGYSATFFNMGLVGLCCLGLFTVFRGKADTTSTLAFLLTVGFGSWGIHVINIWPSVLGVLLYCLVRREKSGNFVNAMLFSTGIAPLITELMLRYPGTQVGFTPVGIALSLLIGILIGFFLPAGLAASPKVHKGFDLYSAALPVGMMAFFLQAVLYKTMGVSLPQALSEAQPESMLAADPGIVNGFCLILFALFIVLAFCMGCRPKDYWQLLKDPELVRSFTGTYGNAVFLMNAGVYGMMILAYYNLIGAPFTGVTLGVIFCMLSTCNSGTHPANLWPILLGYVVSAQVCSVLSQLTGGSFVGAINSQSIVVGLCYANGLSPISDKYGWRYGFLASCMHYLLVTSVPMLHGGFCLYNGGFTAIFVCILLVPVLEKFCTLKADRLAAKAK